MKAKRKIIWLVMIVAFVLAGTTWIIEASADDTYNFYFQKAPGPVTVNQGGAPAAASPDLKLKGETAVQPAATAAPNAATGAPAPAVTAQAAAEEAPSGVHTFELSFGLSGSRYGGASQESPYYYSIFPRSGMMNVGQYTAGIQFNMNENFALLGEVYHLTKIPEDRSLNKAQGSPWDFGGSLVITPFRLKAGGNSHLVISALGGMMTVPQAQGTLGSEDPWITGDPRIGHTNSFFYGARAGFEFWNHAALQASVRRIDRFSSTQGIVSLGFLL